jgi:hypothetical protein
MGSFSSPVRCRVDRCRSGMGEPRKSAMSAVMDFLRLGPGSQVQSGASAAGLIGGWFRSLGGVLLGQAEESPNGDLGDLCQFSGL